MYKLVVVAFLAVAVLLALDRADPVKTEGAAALAGPGAPTGAGSPARRLPRSVDPDHDGLSTRRERRLHTNAHRADTDHDGYRDGAEVRAGSNPRSWRSAPRARQLHCRAHATPGTLRHVFDAARAGQTICLAAGDYGEFDGGSKPGTVIVGARPGVRATMRVNFRGASHIVLDGLTIDGAELRGSTRDVTIRNSRFTDHATINGLQNANVVFDHNTHIGINSGPDTPPARIHLSYGCSGRSGVTVKNSLFAGGDSDGIQAGCGLRIIHNEFRDIQPAGANHTDAIQLLDAAGTVVRRNYFHNTVTGIVAYDGVEHALIEDNVLDMDDRAWDIELYSDDGSVVRHNTLKYYRRGCYFGEPCGMIAVSRKPEDDPGRGTVIVDNVATAITASNGSTIAERAHNLVRRFAGRGDLRGAPKFVGGTDPTGFDGFLLRRGSRGRHAASDGTNVGIG